MNTITKTTISLIIIGAGIGVFLYLYANKPQPKKRSDNGKTTLVEVTAPQISDEVVSIKTMGTVVPARSVTIFPEVSGRIVMQSDKLVPGGRFRAGERIVKIDPRDYDLALKQQKALVNKAQMELATERARGAVARREWSLMEKGMEPTEEGKKLALRQVQLESAEAALASAESALERSLINQSRTVIKAPFNGIITEEHVDKGQVVGPGTKIATIVASDQFWVRVSVPMDKLSWIHIPGMGAPEGSPVKVVQNVGPGKNVERRGKIAKLLSDVDPRGKMARLLIEVGDPLGLKTGSEEDELPLLLGAYVTAFIEGPRMNGALSIPRRALRDGGKAWLKREGKLEIVGVEVIWSTEEKVWVRGDITAEDQVVLTRIAAPVSGMPLALHNGKRSGNKESGAVVLTSPGDGGVE